MSDESPKVSVVVCVYNGYGFLKDIERFIERQTFKDYEILFVVDSRSTDGTAEEVADYCDRNPKARYVMHTEPTKLGGAKNHGMECARGKYIWFLDVDDIPSETFLERMVAAKEETGSDIAVCNFQYTDDRDWKASETGKVLTMSGSIALHMRSLNLIPVTSWAMLYDKAHVERNGIKFREMMAEDIAFTYFALNASDKVCYITAPLYGYYQNDNSFCKSNADERGRLELENYMYLSEMFPKENRYLQARFCFIGLRSLTHMTSKGFKETVRKDELKRYVNENLPLIGRTEYAFIRLFPCIYHSGVSWYIRNFYCKTGKIYTDRKKMRTIGRILKHN